MFKLNTNELLASLNNSKLNILKQYNVNVICKYCHRMNMLEIFKIISEEEVTKNSHCPSCGVKGGIIYASSIGKKHIFH